MTIDLVSQDKQNCFHEGTVEETKHPVDQVEFVFLKKDPSVYTFAGIAAVWRLWKVWRLPNGCEDECVAGDRGFGPKPKQIEAG